MIPLLDKSILFFGGKGGVGKTTCAAAFGLFAASRGKRTLVISTDPAHSLGDIFGLSLNEDEQPIESNLWGSEIDPEKESKKYITRIKDHMRRGLSSVIVSEISRQLDAAYSSPGAEEAAIFDSLMEKLDGLEQRFDLVVFDTAPTGHTLRLLSLPELLGMWLDRMIERRRTATNLLKQAGATDASLRGKFEEDPVIEILARRRQMFEKTRSLFTDPGRSAFVFVVTPEKLPIIETRKAIAVLQKYEVPVSGVVVNRILPGDADGEFLARRREVEVQYLQQIESLFGPMVLARIPLGAGDIFGIETLRSIAGRFAQPDGR